MSSRTRQQLEAWLKQIDIKGSVLDIGGSQNPIKGRTKTWNATEYKILDLKQPHECRQNPDYIGNIEDSQDIQWDIFKDRCIWDKAFWPEPNYHFDAFDNVFMLEVSEYLINPLLALDNINKLLKKDGLFYSSWHFIYPQHPPKGLDYLRYTPDGVEKLLTETGFEILEHIPRRTEVVDLKEVWSAEKMRGWKDFDNKIIGSLVKARKL